MRTPGRAVQNNLRDNGLKTCGWTVMRFNGEQIKESLNDYCLPLISSNVRRLGGIHEGRIRFVDDSRR